MLLENEILKTCYLYDICYSQDIKVCLNQHQDLLRILFTNDSLKIINGLKQVSLP